MSFYDRIQNLTAWQAIGRPALSYCAASCTAGVVLAVGMPRTGVLRFGPQAIQDVLAGAVAGLTYWLAMGRPSNPRAR